MRTSSIAYGAKTATLTYPDNVVFQRDRNIVMVELSDNTDTVELTVSLTDTGGTYTLTYNSPFHFLVMDISELVEQITDLINTTTTIDFTITATDSGGTQTTVTHSATSYVHKGRTIAGRRHGANTTVRYYANFPLVQYFDGTTISTENTAAATPAADGNIYVAWNSGGDVLDPFTPEPATNMQSVCIKEKCVPARSIWLKFTNTDGCLRYVAGKPLAVETSSDGIAYATDSVSVQKPAERITTVQYAYTVGVDAVEYAEHLTDILFADDVMYSIDGSTFENCKVENVEYQSDGGTHGMKIKIYTNL